MSALKKRWRMILLNIKLKNKIKELVKNSDIKDIILFGSAVRGKENPKDIDILVLFKEKIDKEKEYEIRKALEKDFSKISIISKTEKTVLEPSFDAREGLLFEGISLITDKRISEFYGFFPYGLFRYDFKNWSNLQKTKFYYALNGRGDNKGVLDVLNGIKFSDNVILLPVESIESFKKFLESWEINFKYIPILIPERLAKIL